MSVNEFEQQVQHKLSELQLRPSVEVWEEVEKHIRKEKKRRRIIFWFFIFGALLLGGAGWWITNLNNDKTVNSITTNTNSTSANEISIDKATTDSAKVVLQNKKTGKNDKVENNLVTNTLIPEATNEVQSAPAEKSLTKKKDIKASLHSTKHFVEKVTTTEIETAQIIPPQQPTASGNKIKTDAVTTPSFSDTKNTELKKDDSAVQIANSENAIQPTVAKENESILNKKNDSVASNDVKAIVPIKINKNKKWEWGITSGIGVSGISEGNSIFAREKSYMANSSQLISAGVFRGPISPTIYTVASPKNGLSWHLGIYGKKKLTKRTAIVTGVNFSSYATVQQTGALVDSSRVFTSSRGTMAVNNFYLNGTAGSHTNHYYYLQIPVYYNWQLNKGNRFPLYFQNGLSIGFLAGSDAIVYNDLANVFYQDKKQLNKLQLAYQSGLFTNIFKQSKKPLSAGLVFNYSISKLQKENTIGNKHLASFGIQLGWKLKK